MTSQNESKDLLANPGNTRNGGATRSWRLKGSAPGESERSVGRGTRGARWRGWALAALAGLAGAVEGTRLALTQSGTVALTTSGDTYLKQGTPNSNQGAETLLRIQQSGSNRVLVQFDQAALEQAVGSSSIRSAKLRLYIAANANNWGTNGREVNVHRLLQAWTEPGATWNCPHDTNTANGSADCSPSWDMGGSSLPPFVIAPTQVILHQNNQTGWVEWDVTGDVRGFLAHTATNQSWLGGAQR